MKILGKLSAKGIVCSYRGTGGGYEITGEPKNITLYAVVEAAGGDYLFSRCLGNGYCCERGGELPCTYREVFMEVTDKVREVLESKTFDNL
jgi:Rrf2 family protein